MECFRAFRIDQDNDRIVAGFCNLSLDDLTAGEVVIKVSHSTINYKDALAATGAGKILRTYPLVGGIDLAGTIVSSEDEQLQPEAHYPVDGRVRYGALRRGVREPCAHRGKAHNRSR